MILIRNQIESGEDEVMVTFSKAVLDKVIVYCTHINTNEPPTIQKPLTSNELGVNEFYTKYIDVPKEELFQLIMAADLSDCSSLMELASAKVASLIRGKSVEEQRQFFNANDDHSAEDKERIKDEIKVAEQAC